MPSAVTTLPERGLPEVEEVSCEVVRLEGKLCIFPGKPKLFRRMLSGLTPYLPLPPPEERPCRQQIFTSLPESSIAPYLTSLHGRVNSEGVRVGSYPLLKKGVYVSLIGRDTQRIRELAAEVESELQGRMLEAKQGKDTE